MKNPFENLGRSEENKVVDDWEDVEDSVLACGECGKKSTSGKYSDSREKLVWSCPNEHKNSVSIKL